MYIQSAEDWFRIDTEIIAENELPIFLKLDQSITRKLVQGNKLPFVTRRGKKYFAVSDLRKWLSSPHYLRDLNDF